MKGFHGEVCALADIARSVKGLVSCGIGELAGTSAEKIIERSGPIGVGVNETEMRSGDAWHVTVRVTRGDAAG